MDDKEMSKTDCAIYRDGFMVGGLISEIQTVLGTMEFLCRNPKFEEAFSEAERKTILKACSILAERNQQIVEDAMDIIVRHPNTRCVTVGSIEELEEFLKRIAEEGKEDESEYKIIG